ncbi:RHS repeat-associated core domain-containing protein [Mitsuaria sp. GD03876]|uniref:RHS repeat domain-containing protein n=1 Tax=Mitsuaria sp. GD03876 TaxID=2975399 RepID=UPI00244D7AD1|nr:RHS repeat-associated core domain-containing protein [Mitsuaria sp. GD03876]MDH0863426.1 hypothetical protein [Mitsuaria sp. GD03876]
MNTNRHDRGAAVARPGQGLLPVMGAVMALAATCQAAQAQEVNPNPAPSVQLIDPMGVDMTSGRIRYVGGVLSIGDAGKPALSTNWFSYNIGVTGATPLGGAGYSEYVCIRPGQFGCAGIGAMHYKLGDRVVLDVALKKYGGDVSGNVVTEPDGTQWTFAPYSSASPPYLGTNTQARMAATLQSVRYPDGEQLTFTYANGTAIRAVVSSRGYMLHLTPGTVNGWSRAVMINLRDDYCDPNAPTCTPGAPKSLVVTAQTADGATTVTDPAGRIARLVATGADPRTMTVSTPEGRSLSWTERLLGVMPTCLAGSSVTTQAATSAGTWNYAYTFATNYCNTGVAPDFVATDALGGTTSVKGNGTTYADPLGRVSYYGWSLLGSTRDQVTGGSAPVSVIPPSGGSGGSLNDAYGSLYKPSTMTRPEGDRVEYTYDGRWNLIKTELKPKPGSGQTTTIVTSASYRACTNVADFKVCNQPQTTTDADGKVTTYTYDPASGKVATVTLPEVTSPAGTVQPQTRHEYSALYAVYRQAAGAAPARAPAPIYRLTRKASCLTMTLATCAGTVDEVVTTYGYNDNLQLAWTTTASGDGARSATVSFEYDTLGDLVKQTGPLAGQITRHFYDAARQRYATIGADPDGDGPSGAPVTWTTYDKDGLPVSVRAGYSMSGELDGFVPMQETRTAYDGAKRKVSEEVFVEGVLASRTSLSYDALNRPLCTTVRMNLAVAAPADACEAGPAGPAGPDRITRHAHDAAGQLQSVKQAVGTALERVERTQTFTANGKLATIADANGNLTATVYDGFDRAARTKFPNPSLPGAANENDYEEIQAYDGGSRPLVRRLRDGNLVRFGYDALGRVTSTEVTPLASGEAARTTYVHDAAGHLRSASDSNGSAVIRAYDALGCKTSEQDAFGTKRIDCDAAGRPVRLTYADGLQLRYAHRLDDQFLSIGEVNGAELMAYGYDAAGRQRRVTRGNGVVSTVDFGAGAIGVTAFGHAVPGAAVNIGLSYSPAGQVTGIARDNGAYGRPTVVAQTSAYGVNGLNQLTTVDGAPTVHDARGNLTQAQGHTWAYTVLNRLAGADGATLTYDAMGRLSGIRKGAATTRFEYIGESLIAERDQDGTLLRRFVPGRTADDPQLWYEGAGTSRPRWMHVDQQGSVIAVTESEGRLLAINRYDEYGQPAAGNVGRHQYTGQLWLPEVGLHSYKARMYHPGLGRFLQTDPVGYGSGDLNLYAYVGNDPINRADPSGETCRIQQQQEGQRDGVCRIDKLDGKELTDEVRNKLSKALQKFIAEREAEMTRDFKKLLGAKQSRSVTASLSTDSGTAVDITFKVGELTQLFIDTQITLNTSASPDGAAGKALGDEIALYQPGLRNAGESGRASVYLHEMIHLTDKAKEWNRVFGVGRNNPQIVPERHNSQFDQAIRQMFK